VGIVGAGWLAFRPSGAGKASPQPASGRTSCAQALLNDWADGRIDRTYPIRCYREALRTLPADLEVYSSASDDIEPALRDRIVQRRRLTAGSVARGAE
jgi:hypothetical protein